MPTFTHTFPGRASTLATSYCPIKRETLVRPALILSLVLLLAGSAWGQIDMPDETPVGEKIVATIGTTGAPEGAVLKGIVPRVRGCQWAYGPTNSEIHIWGKPGTYTLDAIVQWGIPDAENPGSWKDFGIIGYEADFKITGSVTPDPPPVVNPYKPAPAYQAAAQPVQALSLSQTDSQALAAMYATVAQQARANAYKSLGEVRADLVKRGSLLNLKGKYASLPQVVEAYLQASLGLEEVVPTASVGDVLETLAWAVFESGRDG